MSVKKTAPEQAPEAGASGNALSPNWPPRAGCWKPARTPCCPWRKIWMARLSRRSIFWHQVKGRVIVSGMGKSGHIARKIAATFASTGTPAQFIHPAEASHGDLGMITRADACLMLSNSGETPELGDIIAHTRRFAIPLIGMARNPDSTLLRAADVALVLPPAPEACPMGLAPTTSTTVSLALGDALAVALMERKGFSADDFRLLHPGGQIGKSLLRVADIMHTGDALPLARLDMPMSEVLMMMTQHRFGCAGIMASDGNPGGHYHRWRFAPSNAHRGSAAKNCGAGYDQNSQNHSSGCAGRRGAGIDGG